MEYYNPLVIDATLRVHEALKRLQNLSPIWEDDLCGACAVGSELLKEELRLLGIKCHVVVTDNMISPNGDYLGTHCFCVIMDDEGEVQLILDPTFSQIVPYEEVAVLDRSDHYFYTYLEALGDDVFTYGSKEEFKCWIPSQRPSYMITKVKKFLTR